MISVQALAHSQWTPLAAFGGHGAAAGTLAGLSHGPWPVKLAVQAAELHAPFEICDPLVDINI